MNDPIISQPAWQQIDAIGGYVEAFATYFLIGLGLILALQITLFVLQCRELARQESDQGVAAGLRACRPWYRKTIRPAGRDACHVGEPVHQ